MRLYPEYYFNIFNLSAASSAVIWSYISNTNRRSNEGHSVRVGLPVLIQKAAACIALLLLSPILLLAMLSIRLESKGDIFYSQVRLGHHGRHFKIWKLRSMYIATDDRYVDINNLESDREGTCKKLFKDPRITSVGRIIRKLSIDELPQLWNVIIGDMVMIGPRPALPIEVDDYAYQMLSRMDVIPGLTGLWQVSGRADTTFEEQIKLDLSYVNRQSVWLDIKILFATVPAVLLGKGAY